MDVQYLFLQVLLLMAIFVGIRYVSCMKETNICRFLKMNLSETGIVLYNKFTHYIDKEKIHAYDKYEMWRYIEHRRESSFIHEYYSIKENVINGEFCTNIWRNNKRFI